MAINLVDFGRHNVYFWRRFDGMREKSFALKEEREEEKWQTRLGEGV